MCSDGLTEIHTEVSSMPGAWTDYLHHHCYCILVAMVQVMVKLRMVTMVVMIMAMRGAHNNHENGWKQQFWFLKTQFGVKRCGDTAIASCGQKYDSVLIIKLEATKTSTNGNAVKTLHIRSQEREATPKCSMANQLVSCQHSGQLFKTTKTNDNQEPR